MKKSYKDDNFGSRMANAAKAREAVLARIKAQPGPGDPAFEKRQAERKAAAEARATRLAKKKAEKEEAEKKKKEEDEKKQKERAEKEKKEKADKIKKEEDY